MPNTPSNPSGRTLTDGAAVIEDVNNTEANKAKVIELFDILINGQPEAIENALAKYFDPEYLQHNPDAADGIQGFVTALQAGKLVFTTRKQHKVIGEGNFVLSISEGTHRGNPAIFYDLVRFADGMIVEHWDVIQDIPSEHLANDNTMFNF
ncbi:MAG: hypothetical protein AAFU67_08770 [Bacteroidota bacterium]